MSSLPFAIQSLLDCWTSRVYRSFVLPWILLLLLLLTKLEMITVLSHFSNQFGSTCNTSEDIVNLRLASNNSPIVPAESVPKTPALDSRGIVFNLRIEDTSEHRFCKLVIMSANTSEFIHEEEVIVSEVLYLRWGCQVELKRIPQVMPHILVAEGFGTK